MPLCPCPSSQGQIGQALAIGDSCHRRAGIARRGPVQKREKNPRSRKGPDLSPGPPSTHQGTALPSPTETPLRGQEWDWAPALTAGAAPALFPAGPPHCPASWSREPCCPTGGPSRVPSSLSPLPGRHSLRLKRRPEPSARSCPSVRLLPPPRPRPPPPAPAKPQDEPAVGLTAPLCCLRLLSCLS